MRRLLALLTLPVVTAACQLASAASLPVPGPTPSVEGPPAYAAAAAGQSAEAMWTLLRGDTGLFYFAGAYRAAEAGAYEGVPFGGVQAIGFVGRGTCTVHRGRNFTVVSCSGRGWGRRLSPTQFDADPLLESAKLRMRARGYRHVVRWNGRGTHPEPGGGAFFGLGYVEGGVGAGRAAKAKARLFGRRLPRRGGPFTYLAEGAGAFAFADVRLGRFDFERRFRFPARA